MNQYHATAAVDLICRGKQDCEYNTYRKNIINTYSIKNRQRVKIKKCICCKKFYNVFNFKFCPSCNKTINKLIYDITVNSMISYELVSKNKIMSERRLDIWNCSDFNSIIFQNSMNVDIVRNNNGDFLLSPDLNYLIDHFTSTSYTCSNCYRVIKFSSFKYNDNWVKNKNNLIMKLLMCKFIFTEVIELSYLIFISIINIIIK